MGYKAFLAYLQANLLLVGVWRVKLVDSNLPVNMHCYLEDHDADQNMLPEVKEKLDAMLKDIAKAMDEYGAGGYNGISRKSMLLSQKCLLTGFLAISC